MLDSNLPAFRGNISFNAHHSPMGAYWSFTCGHHGTRGGFDVQSGRPGDQDIYIGIKRGRRDDRAAPITCLPFFERTQAPDPAAEAFPAAVHEPPGPKPDPVGAYQPADISRRYGWATDRWTTADFDFTIYTPFGGIVDPTRTHPSMSRVCLMPAILATLTIDNTGSAETRTGFFAIKFHQRGVHQLPQQHGWRGKERIGFGLGRNVGFQAMLETEPHDRGAQMHPFQRWTLADGLNDANPIHGLGDCAGIAFEVPPGTKRTLLIALGVFIDGVVTTGLEGKYYYTRHFSSLLDVLDHALRAYDAIRAGSAELDRELLDSKLSADQQFLIAHSTRSYYGNTQLLDLAGDPFWIVNEGEYQMMNTLDLAVDQVFWELKQNPWVVRNLLDNFLKHYSYYDRVKVPVAREQSAKARLHEGKTREQGAGSVQAQHESVTTIESQSDEGGGGGAGPEGYELAPGGISFAHDMGVANAFAPPGHSSYEMSNLAGCFSYMTQEQLCNWILIAASYLAKTNDTEWLMRHRDVAMSCFRSMINREENADGNKQSAGGGAMRYDSERCGGEGQEITTYDSLDASLGQARDNLYIAVKRVVAYLGLEFLFCRLGETAAEEAAGNAARIAAEAVTKRLDPKTGFIPAIFDPNNPGHQSRILPAVEALLFPWYWGNCEYGLEHKASHDWQGTGGDSFIGKLKKHTLALLNDPQKRNLFPDGGIRLSSTSNNSWMSKIAVFQHVARELLRVDDDPKLAEVFRNSDAAHVKWQTDGSGYWACCDQLVNGKAVGSRYYPRAITTTLWLDRA
jgi:hypothetical protein